MAEVQVYAHRGASGYALENSWEAFHRAKDMADGIEVDVHITADGVVIVYHDDHTNRLTGKKSFIEQSEYETLKNLRIGKRWSRLFRHQTIPLGYEFFQWAKKERIPLNVELKNSFLAHPQGPKILAAMLDGVSELHISSFYPELLRSMKELMLTTETALIIKKNVSLDAVRRMPWVDALHFHKRMYKPAFLAAFEELGKPLRVYGVKGNEKFLQQLHPLVTGIITDYPDRVTKKLRPAIDR